MSEFEATKATRQGFIPLIGLYGQPGSGKTYSALLLARGIAGPHGKVVIIDTESGRARLFADEIPGGFFHVPLNPPFSPARYDQAVKAQFKDAAVVVIDSTSHCWEGEGGVCDQAAASEERTKRRGMHNWIVPKMELGMFVRNTLMRAPIPIICCTRGKRKTRQTEDERGKAVIQKDEFATPIQEADFTFELTFNAEVLPETHALRITKTAIASFTKCFPSDGPIEIQHGEMIARWCAAGGSPAFEPPSKKATTPLDDAKARLWSMTKAKHGKDVKALEAFLRSANLIDPEATLSGLSLEKVEHIIAAIEKEGLLL